MPPKESPWAAMSASPIRSSVLCTTGFAYTTSAPENMNVSPLPSASLIKFILNGMPCSHVVIVSGVFVRVMSNSLDATGLTNFSM